MNSVIQARFHGEPCLNIQVSNTVAEAGFDDSPKANIYTGKNPTKSLHNSRVAPPKST